MRAGGFKSRDDDHATRARLVSAIPAMDVDPGLIVSFPPQ